MSSETAHFPAAFYTRSSSFVMFDLTSVEILSLAWIWKPLYLVTITVFYIRPIAIKMHFSNWHWLKRQFWGRVGRFILLLINLKSQILQLVSESKMPSDISENIEMKFWYACINSELKDCRCTHVNFPQTSAGVKEH